MLAANTVISLCGIAREYTKGDGMCYMHVYNASFPYFVPVAQKFSPLANRMFNQYESNAEVLWADMCRVVCEMSEDIDLDCSDYLMKTGDMILYFSMSDLGTNMKASLVVICVTLGATICHMIEGYCSKKCYNKDEDSSNNNSQQYRAAIKP